MTRRTATPAASTERWRRWQARQQAGRGETYIRVKVDHRLIELMLDRGKIDDRGSEDPEALAEAILRCCVEYLSNAFDTPRRK